MLGKQHVRYLLALTFAVLVHGDWSPFICLLPDICYAWFRRIYFPSPVDKIIYKQKREKERDNVLDVLVEEEHVARP